MILFTGGVSASVHAGIHPLGRHTPPGSRHTPTPGSRHPPEKTPPEQTPLHNRQPPPRADTPWEQTPLRSRHPPGADTTRKACWEIQSTRGRYAYHWNAILLRFCEQNSIMNSLYAGLDSRMSNHCFYGRFKSFVSFILEDS